MPFIADNVNGIAVGKFAFVKSRFRPASDLTDRVVENNVVTPQKASKRRVRLIPRITLRHFGVHWAEAVAKDASQRVDRVGITGTLLGLRSEFDANIVDQSSGSARVWAA